MINFNIFEHMTAEELREHAAKMAEMNNEYSMYVIALTSAIEKYENLLELTHHVDDENAAVASRRRRLYEFEQAMEKKYDEYIPKPMNDCIPKPMSAEPTTTKRESKQK